MLIAIIPILVLIIGLLMWVLSSNPKVSEAGKILFAIGALVLTWQLGGETLRIG